MIYPNRHVAPEIAMTSNLIRRKVSAYYNSEDSLTLSQRKIIHYLVLNKDHDVYQRDIEKIFYLRRSTATGILKLMEDNGLITREKIKTDSRLKKIILTEKTLELYNKVHYEIAKFEKDTVKGISEKDLETFYRVIDKIKENLS